MITLENLGYVQTSHDKRIYEFILDYSIGKALIQSRLYIHFQSLTVSKTEIISEDGGTTINDNCSLTFDEVIAISNLLREVIK